MQCIYVRIYHMIQNRHTCIIFIYIYIRILDFAPIRCYFEEVLPNFILLASDYFEMRVLEMGFNIRYHLRVNLFRKYLRYTQEPLAFKKKAFI